MKYTITWTIEPKDFFFSLTKESLNSTFNVTLGDLVSILIANDQSSRNVLDELPWILIPVTDSRLKFIKTTPLYYLHELTKDKCPDSTFNLIYGGVVALDITLTATYDESILDYKDELGNFMCYEVIVSDGLERIEYLKRLPFKQVHKRLLHIPPHVRR